MDKKIKTLIINKKNESPKNRFLINPLYQKRLTDSSRFVCYKADKKPYNAETKNLAKVTCLTDYRSFDFACNSVRINQNFKGIGFLH